MYSLYIIIFTLASGHQFSFRAWATGLVMVNSDMLWYHFHMFICGNKL